jgi:hypothetical protein
MSAEQQFKPQAEHQWLQQLVGEWAYEHECVMGPNQSPQKSSGTQTTRSIGGLWIVGEGRGEMPDGDPATMIITLGFDPAKNVFVGTFIGSMMPNLWIYEGRLDDARKVLTLDTEGPSFAGDGGVARYQDIIEVLSPDHYTLSSQMLGDDGQWHRFMTAHYRRAP